MSKCNCKELDKLINKVRQQENTIAQLVGIVANTNNKVASYLTNEDRKSQLAPSRQKL